MAKDIFDTELKKIEKFVLKLRNKMKRADIDYTVQLSRNSADPGKIRYAISMTAPANGLAPVVFIADSSDEIIEQLKASAKKIDYAAIEIAYHEAQIEACKRTILGHEERIEAIKNGEADEVLYDEVDIEQDSVSNEDENS